MLAAQPDALLKWADGEGAVTPVAALTINAGERVVASKHFAKSDLTAEYLRSILDYDPETGLFTWRERPDTDLPWNRKYAGKRAGTLRSYSAGKPGKYVVIMINGKNYLAHRLAWLWVKGEWPPGDLDHRDGNGANNAIENLRPAACWQNLANQGLSRANTTGFKGVTLRKSTGRYVAQIHVHGKNRHLGYFDSPEEAHAAYRKAAREHFGEFARFE